MIVTPNQGRFEVRIAGGSNDAGIGANSWIADYIQGEGDNGKRTRVMVDLGMMFGKENDWMPRVLDELAETDLLVITHAHLDHFGGLMALMEIGMPMPKIACSTFTKSLICEKIREEGGDPSELEFIEVNPFQPETWEIECGPVRLTLPFVSHSVPQALAVAMSGKPDGAEESERTNILFSGDFNLDQSLRLSPGTDADTFASFADWPIHAFFCEMTRINAPGKRPEESLVQESLGAIMDTYPDAHMRFAVMSSHIERVFNMAEECHKRGQKLVLRGRSMETAMRAHDLTMDALEKAATTPEQRDQIGWMKEVRGSICFEYQARGIERGGYKEVGTGTQAEEGSVMHKLGHRQHPFLHLSGKDVIVNCASYIPGNEDDIQKLLDLIDPQVRNLITSRTQSGLPSGERDYADNDKTHLSPDGWLLTTSGHAYEQDIVEHVMRVQPRALVGIHGAPEHREHFEQSFADARKTTQADMPVFLPVNGDLFEVTQQGTRLAGHADMPLVAIRTSYMAAQDKDDADEDNDHYHDKRHNKPRRPKR